MKRKKRLVSLPVFLLLMAVVSLLSAVALWAMRRLDPGELRHRGSLARIVVPFPIDRLALES